MNFKIEVAEDRAVGRLLIIAGHNAEISFREAENRRQSLTGVAARPTKFPAIIFALNLHSLAHFVEARSDARADTILQSLRFVILGNIAKVGREDGDAFLVISGVDYLHHRVAHPVGGLGRAQLIQHQNIRFKDRLKYSQL